jgi:hypothetical protein
MIVTRKPTKSMKKGRQHQEFSLIKIIRKENSRLVVFLSFSVTISFLVIGLGIPENSKVEREIPDV